METLLLVRNALLGHEVVLTSSRERARQRNLV